jgi:hypothetical protein
MDNELVHFLNFYHDKRVFGNMHMYTSLKILPIIYGIISPSQTFIYQMI